ncbi:hypothetical protein ECTW15901_0336, partial [Escherichia coli TW15901]
RVQ